MRFASKEIVVGIDPGTTVGISILDTKGNLMLVTSRKNAKRNEVVNLISNFGKPIIISTDRNPAPKYVEKLASSFGAKIFCPEKHITLAQKKNLTKKFLDEVKNSHEKDSLAAAVKAWKSYKRTFEYEKFGGFLQWLRRKR